jgi:hypothetical protein
MNTRALILVAALGLPASLPAQQHPAATMSSFTSDSAMRAFLRRFARPRRSLMMDGNAIASPMAGAAPSEAQSFSRAASPDAITNVQQQGVDEGDIVKLAGDYLVILRRGRLFTLALGDGTLRPASTSNAFGPGIDPSGTWYDEMLISGDKVVVIGYSYERGGTEAFMFVVTFYLYIQ